MTQDEALDLLKLGHNVFLTGAAGSGKTYLLNKYIRNLRHHRVGVAVTASTGIAATHLNGRTIHSWSGIGVRDALTDSELETLSSRDRVKRNYKKTKVLIIDEISMLHPHQLDMVHRIARRILDGNQPFGGLQVVLCGDFFQLPPVSPDSVGIPKAFAYESSAWGTGGFQTCYLHEQYRQVEDPLLAVLNDIRSGNAGEQTKVPLRTRYKKDPHGSVRPTKLYARNVNVDSVNTRELRALEGEEEVFRMETTGFSALVEGLKRGCLAPVELRLKAGAKVMFVKNAIDGSFVNGTLGVVEDFDDDEGWPVVRTFDNALIVAEPQEWKYEEHGVVRAMLTQVPLKLAWAITVHKSQGMTLDAAEIDLSDAFEPGMGYVALSRVRSLSGLRLLGLNETALTVHPKILRQDHTFKEWSESASEMLRKISGREKEKQQADVLKHRFAAKKGKSAVRKTWSMDEYREDYPNAYMPWSQEDDEKLRKLFLEKMPVQALSSIFGRQPGGIRGRLRKLDLIEVISSDERPHSENKKKDSASTQQITRGFIERKMSINEIAGERGLTVGTIVSHLEKLKGLDDLPDIDYIKKPIKDFHRILEAFQDSPDGKLAPVHQKLEGQYSFDDLRVVRLFVDQ
ncbi:MAG: AAA family ATPase [Gammaproteobacteria bacterium]